MRTAEGYERVTPRTRSLRPALPWLAELERQGLPEYPTHGYTAHLRAYDYEELADLCAEAGFRKVSLWPHDPHLANPERKWGSVYAVAVK
jgi:hypothetical protein